MMLYFYSLRGEIIGISRSSKVLEFYLEKIRKIKIKKLSISMIDDEHWVNILEDNLSYIVNEVIPKSDDPADWKLEDLPLTRRDLNIIHWEYQKKIEELSAMYDTQLELIKLTERNKKLAPIGASYRVAAKKLADALSDINLSRKLKDEVAKTSKAFEPKIDKYLQFAKVVEGNAEIDFQYKLRMLNDD